MTLTKAVLASPHIGEFIIVDDGSTDGTSEFLAEMVDPRIRVFLQERNQGRVLHAAVESPRSSPLSSSFRMPTTGTGGPTAPQLLALPGQQAVDLLSNITTNLNLIDIDLL